jgi:hypothetical protein
VLLGALFNLKKAHYFTDVPDFDGFGFWKGRVYQAPESYPSEMIGDPNCMAGGALSKHALDIGEGSRGRHLCRLLVGHRVRDRYVIAGSKWLYFTV